jgi:uncharacterized protein (TIGR03437 family)
VSIWREEKRWGVCIVMFTSLLGPLSLIAHAESFVVPSSGTLFMQCIGGSAGAVSQFGTGTSQSNFMPYLTGLPQSCPTAEVSIGAVSAGQTVVFGIQTSWQGQTYWAFSNGTDPASVIAFSDTHNSLGMGGNIIQQTSANTWVMHLDDAASYLVDDNNADILIQLRLGGTAAPAPLPHGDMNFTVPTAGTLYLSALTAKTGADWKFGIGTTSGNCNIALASLPSTAPPTGEVSIGSYNAGDVLSFCMWSQYAGNTAWAFSDGNDAASVIAFWDTHNTLGMGGKVIQQTSPTTWTMHLDNAVSYLYDDSNDDILIQIRVDSSGPGAPTGGVFVAPSAGTLYLRCIGGSAGATSQFGIGTSPTTFVSYLSSLPQSCPDAEVAAGTVSAGQTVPFGIETFWGGQTYWAFSTNTDQGSIVSFTDTNNSLGMGGSIIQPTGANTWALHLNDAAHYTLSSAEANNILIQVRLQAPVGPPPTTITGVGNSASFQPGLSPGMLATLFGTNLSPVARIAAPGGATSYQGVSVTVGGRLAPLFAIANLNGSEQINFQVPAELTAPNMVTVQVNNNGSIGTTNVPLALIQPGIFEYNPAGSLVSYAAILNPDGSIVGPSNPAARGSTVVMFLTGLGPMSPFVGTGQPGPVPVATTIYQPVVLGLDNTGVPVMFSGLAPYFVGLDQVNFTIPYDSQVGPGVAFSLSINGVSSQVSRIAVQ